MANRSIALTRIHTPEDYWLRMALAEQKLYDFIDTLNPGLDAVARRCGAKAMQLGDRYHERWDPKLYRLER